MELTTTDVIRQLAAPAVMISAAGLLAISTNARYMFVLGQFEGVRSARRDLRARPLSDDRTVRHARELQLTMMHERAGVLLRAARFLRASLVLLMMCVLSMIGASACVGMSAVANRFYPGALMFFGVGAGALSGAAVAATIELSLGLGPSEASLMGDGCSEDAGSLAGGAR